jgi:aspartyl-tRNA(Asn)/glutamyl-tRNA(Gln) amidotransferase subunit A
MIERFKGIEELRALTVANPDSILDLTTNVLANLDGLGRELKAVAHLSRADALAKAEELRHQPDRSSLLFGIPLALKDLYMRKGWPCEGGSKTLCGHRANQTAFAVVQLDRAGFIDCGRLTTVELALGTTGHNEYAGTPTNPWNPEYICGGSSSGSGAAVASGIIAASLGTDTGGSIRLPAAACGLVGIKPTHGLVGRSGVIALSPTLDTVGPLTRSVRDGAIILQVIAGKDKNDPHSVSLGRPNFLSNLEDEIAGIRIGWPMNYFFENTEGSVADGINDVFRLAGQLGAECKDVAVPGIETANAMAMIIIAVESSALHERTVLKNHVDFEQQTLSRLLVGSFIPARDYHNAIANRAAAARQILAETFEQVDAVITPVWPYPLPTIAASDLRAYPEAADMVLQSGHNTRPVNYLGFPAVTLPTGFDANNNPTSVQLIGAPYMEGKLLRIARALERELDFWSVTPGLSSFVDVVNNGKHHSSH